MADGDPRVAVVMLTHNRREEVLVSLDQLTRLPERPRIVVVDNASSDGTAQAVVRRFPQVEVLPAGGNLGAAARNLGVRQIETPYVALCDDDTWWEPGALAHAADLFDAHPRLAVATARILVGPENKEDPICAELERSPLPSEPDMPGPSLLGFMAGASVVRRSAFLSAGGFEPRFFIGGEEELLAIDLVAAGWWLSYVPRLVVHHHPSERRERPLVGLAPARPAVRPAQKRTTPRRGPLDARNLARCDRRTRRPALDPARAPSDARRGGRLFSSAGTTPA
jgi:GT2 family glycosyltransferase